MKVRADSARRRYRMSARAEAAAATRERILDAALELFWERPTPEISLDEVARRAAVSVQTVIRHFGGKKGLVAAAGDRELGRIREQRFDPEPGDLDSAIAALVEHYEELGDRVLRMLAEEQRTPAMQPFADRGREVHREWCQQMFGLALERRSGVERERLLAQLVAACDVYTWKLLRRDSRLSRRQTELAIRELVDALTGGV